MPPKIVKMSRHHVWSSEESDGYLIVLEVSVLGLNGVELVAECKEVLVSLLNLEYLCLQLRN